MSTPEWPAAAPAHDAPSLGSGAAARAAPLALIEVLERDGRVRTQHRVLAWPCTFGRAIDNHLVLDDPHVAAHHALIEAGPAGALQLRVLPGVNGVRCGQRLVAAGGEPVALEARDLHAGQTRLRVRLPDDQLEPERALPTARVGRPTTLVLAVALWLWVLAEHAISLDPGSKPSEWLPPLVGAPFVVVLWCLLWALASKIFQHRFDFWPHVAVAVTGVLCAEVTMFALQWLSALSGWPGFSRLVTGAAAAIAVVALWAHARIVVPQHRRALGAMAAASYVAGAAILLGLNQQRQERWFSELYASVLPPPRLLWHRPTPHEAFAKRIEDLRPALEKSTAEARERDDDEFD